MTNNRIQYLCSRVRRPLVVLVVQSQVLYVLEFLCELVRLCFSFSELSVHLLDVFHTHTLVRQGLRKDNMWISLYTIDDCETEWYTLTYVK